MYNLQKRPKRGGGGIWMLEAKLDKREWLANDEVTSHDAMIAVEDPSTGKEITRIADASGKDVGRAVAAAKATFGDGRWLGLSPMQRERPMICLADLLKAHADEMAELEVIDTALPFGGYKESGIGREQGQQGIEAHLETKTVIIQL